MMNNVTYQDSYNIKATKKSNSSYSDFKIKTNLKKSMGSERTDGGLQSQESPSALGGATAAEQHLPLHAAHLVVVVPRELRACPNPPAQGRRGQRQRHLTLTALTLVLLETTEPSLNRTVSGFIGQTYFHTQPSYI